MLQDLFSRDHGKYEESRFGAELEAFADWLAAQGHLRHPLRLHLHRVRKVLDGCDRFQPGRMFKEEDLRQAFIVPGRGAYLYLCTGRIFARFLAAAGRLTAVEHTDALSLLRCRYHHYLAEVRGLSQQSLKQHGTTVADFLSRGLSSDRGLLGLIAADVETFVQIKSQENTRQSLQHIVAHLRAFLRYCGDHGEAPGGLDIIDMPRVYRGELPPRALDWTTVRRLLVSIWRRSPRDWRDYTVLHLMAYYGLRPCEVAALRLDAVDWEAGTLRVDQRKTRSILVLPLAARTLRLLRRYVQVGRANSTLPQLFLRIRSPIRAMNHYGIIEIFIGLPGAVSRSTARRPTHCAMPSPCDCCAAASASRSLATCLDIEASKQLASTCGLTSTCCGRSGCRYRALPHSREATMCDAAPTPLGQWIAAWLTHQRSLGRGYNGEQWVLTHLQRFVVSTSAADLDQAGFDRWCASFAHLSATTRRGRQLAVRKFCLFRQRTEADCFVPDPLYFARLCPYRRPVIIEPSQVEQMLMIADSLAPTANSPLLPGAMRLALVILYTAGLRRGELARLALEDVEPQTGVLRIRTSKFHKSRLVPLSPTANDALRAYLRHRLATPFDTDPRATLLCWGRHGRHGYTGAGLGQAINRLLVAADVLDAEGRRPRVQDMRHSFAVQALMRWYRDGADVQSNLPRLAIYMGHVSIVSTAHYLHFVPAMRQLASDRFEVAFGNVIEEVSA